MSGRALCDRLPGSVAVTLKTPHASRVNERPSHATPSVLIRVAARYLGVTPATLRNWERDGIIRPHRTAGGHRRFLVSELERLRSAIARVAKEPWSSR